MKRDILSKMTFPDNRREIHKHSHKRGDQLPHIAPQHRKHRKYKGNRFIKYKCAQSIINQSEPVEIWAMTAYQKSDKCDHKHTQMIEKLFRTYCGRQYADRELHLRYDVRLGKDRVASALDTWLDKPPGGIAHNKPRKIIDISHRFPLPRNTKNQPVGQNLYGRRRKVPEDPEFRIPHIRQKFIFRNAVDTVQILEILR